ncbi:MAG TPA: hypothetical protein VLI54_04525 [Bacillota bacterium]|nr:hypothetical protein [Bacillota bacterium]
MTLATETLHPQTEDMLFDQKLMIALGMGVDCRNKTVSGHVLYDTIYQPEIFNEPHVADRLSDPRYPDRLYTLAAPLSTDTGPKPEREAFVRDIRTAITDHDYMRSIAYPDALHALSDLAIRGQVIVWTEGDPIEQLRKMHYTGISDLRRSILMTRDHAVTPANLTRAITPLAVTDKKSAAVFDYLAAAQDGRQVFVIDDRAANIAAATAGLQERGVESTPIWVQQGRHGRLPANGYTEAELRATYNAVTSVADLPARTAELSNDKQMPLFVCDLDDVVVDSSLQQALQANSVRAALQRYGLDPEVVRAFNGDTIIDRRLKLTFED